MSAKGTLRFGPNRVKIDIQRAKRDRYGKPLRDAEGKILYHDEIEHTESHNITVTMGLNAARDWLFNSASTFGFAHHMALSCSAHVPDVADETLDAEIVADGLERAVGTYSVAACSDGECILSHEWTAAAEFVDVQLMGLFDAAVAGNLYFEATIPTAHLLIGDKITGSWDKIAIS